MILTHTGVCDEGRFPTVDYLFTPITTRGHTSLITVNFGNQNIIHQDSIFGYHSGSERYVHMVLTFLRGHWHWDMEGFSSWTMRVVGRNEVPQQTGELACCVFTCAFAALHLQPFGYSICNSNPGYDTAWHIAYCMMSGVPWEKMDRLEDYLEILE